MNTLNTITASLSTQVSARLWSFGRIKAGLLGTAFAALTLAGCGGGGDSATTNLPVTPRVAAVSGPDAFALFPNPLFDASLSTSVSDPTRCPDLNMLVSCFLQSNDVSYAVAYYAAIDPGNNKDTFAKWKTANGFDNGPTTGVGPLGEVTATLGDAHDLGYGRRMTGRQNADGTLAFYVENYNVDVGGGYGDIWLNVEAAARRDPHWFIGINAIEFSPDSPTPAGKPSFAKFYTFDPVTGARLNEVNLDSRGLKAMPGLCVNCHGGRGDPLTGTLTGTTTRLFARVENTVASLDSRTLRGDLSAKLQPFKVDEFKFFNGEVNGVDYRRPAQEAKFKKLNEMVLCSYPKPSTDTSVDFSGTAPCTRPVAGAHDWQGNLAPLLKAAYGGDGLPNANYADTYVPDSWLLAGRQSLYTNAIKPYCITCHVLRGISHQSDINFLNYTTFATYAPYIKKHVFERGNMPLARLVYENFWADVNDAPKLLADWLAEAAQGSLSVTRDANNKPVRPGLPVADPGPDRVVPPNTDITLRAGQSQFATSFLWELPSGSAARLDSSAASSAAVNPVFRAPVGSYTLTLTASNSAGRSSSKNLTIEVSATAPSATVPTDFIAVRAILSDPAKCAGCHKPGGNGVVIPPIFYDTSYARSDGLGNDSVWLYEEVRGRVNFTDVAASPLLRKPAGHHHGGGAIAGFDDDLAPGASGRTDYDLILNWILNGAPR